jgi:ABC-type multidrug transport system fused ATPase/permease subunit
MRKFFWSNFRFVRKPNDIIEVSREAWKIFSKRDKRKVAFFLSYQLSLSLLDLVGVALLGVLGALSVSGIQSQVPGSRIMKVLEVMQISTLSFQGQIAVVGTLAALVLTARTLASIFFTKKMLYFLSLKSAQISSNLISRIFNTPTQERMNYSTQELLFATTQGVSRISIGLIGGSVTMASDAMMLLVLIGGLLIVDPVTAILLTAFFSILATGLYFLLSRRATILGRKESQLNIQSNIAILEALSLFREISLRNQQYSYQKKISRLRYDLAGTLAEVSFLPNISKYVIESSIIVGAVLIAAIEFSFNSASKAVGVLSIFLAAGMRIAPAIIRLQQGAISIKGAASASRLTLDVMRLVRNVKPLDGHEEKADLAHGDFEGSVRLEELSFCYLGDSAFSLERISLSLEPGKILAIVGPSGSGKSTLVDLLLGILEPNNGSVLISGLKPSMAISNYPGAVSFVPQSVQLIEGTVRENLLLGYETQIISDAMLHECLEVAQLSSIFGYSNDLLDVQVGDQGFKLSGGQRQRLGIARALVTNPRILILDEATSSLDSQVEAELSQAILSLKGKVSLVIIAHRLSTVRLADEIIYLDKGKLIGRGNFDVLREAVPDFDIQAKLLGL